MAKAEKKESTTTEPEAKPAKITQHDVTRPANGTKTARVWEIADDLSAKSGAPADRKPVLDAATSEGINVATAATQYGKWRVFNGLGKAPKAATPVAGGGATVE